MTDWIKGRPYSLVRIDLPKGFHLEMHTQQHQSGKVTVTQSVSLTGGFFNLRTMKLHVDELGNLSTMDKLNKELQWSKEV